MEPKGLGEAVSGCGQRLAVSDLSLVAGGWRGSSWSWEIGSRQPQILRRWAAGACILAAGAEAQPPLAHTTARIGTVRLPVPAGPSPSFSGRTSEHPGGVPLGLGAVGPARLPSPPGSELPVAPRHADPGAVYFECLHAGHVSDCPQSSPLPAIRPRLTSHMRPVHLAPGDCGV